MAPRGCGPGLAMRGLLSLLLVAAAHALCQNSSCAEQSAEARAGGLLGSASQLVGLGFCQPRTYPSTGSLLPITLDTRILDLKWVNVSADGSQQHIYAVTEDRAGFLGGPLWRSEDPARADAWRDITDILRDLLPDRSMPYFGITAVHVSPAAPQHLLIQGRGNSHFASRDGGATFTVVNSPGNTTGFDQGIRFHPRQPEWILAKARRPSCMWYERSSNCGYDLYVTQDFGVSWRNLTAASAGRVSSFRDFEWGARMPMYGGKPTPDEAIFATVFAGDAGAKSLYPGWDKDLHYVVSLDFFASPAARMVPCGNLFEVVANKVYLAVPSDCPLGADGKTRQVPGRAVAGRTVTLYVSDWDGDDFTEVCLPSNLEDDGYNMVHTHDGSAAFVLADHAEPGSRGPTSDSPTSDAYAPAYNASYHTLSLSNVYRRDYLADFVRVEGLPGAYIANRVDPEQVAAGAPSSYRSYLQTRASRNGGADWTPLPLPASFRFAQCNACPTGAERATCALHLHGPTSWAASSAPRPNLYSPASAPGLLLATGNAGTHLDTGASGAACTWASTDGGVSWTDVADRPLIYEIGAGGDVIVAAGHASDGPTKTVRFSADGGACWHDITLPEAVLVDNIRAEPGEAGTLFLVHGSACSKTERHPDCTFQGGARPPGKMFVIDIPQLVGTDLRACTDADYEVWEAPSPGACLLGQHVSFRRRRVDATCYSPPAAAAARTVPLAGDRCACSVQADTECEYGFQRGDDGGCEPIPGLDRASCPRWGNDVYRASSTHLRLVHGDVCEDPKAVIPDTDGKGGGGGGRRGADGGGCHNGSKSGWRRVVYLIFVTLLITGIVLVCAGLIWTHCMSAQAREALAEKASPVVGLLSAAGFAVLDAVIGVWDWARFKWAEVTHRGSARDAYFEPLTDRLDVDPEDHRSPPVFTSTGNGN